MYNPNFLNKGHNPIYNNGKANNTINKEILQSQKRKGIKIIMAINIVQNVPIFSISL